MVTLHLIGVLKLWEYKIFGRDQYNRFTILGTNMFDWMLIFIAFAIFYSVLAGFWTMCYFVFLEVKDARGMPLTLPSRVVG